MDRARAWRMMAAGTPLRRMAGVVAMVVLIEAVAVGSIYLLDRARLGREMSSSFSRTGPDSDRYEWNGPGIRLPPTVPAEAARLDDSDEVIGIVAGGRARAYRLAAMKGPTSHIINDVVGGGAVSVTYCDIGECVRAFAGPGDGGPHDIGQGGLKGRRMVIRLGETYYLQDTGEPLGPGEGEPPFPLSVYPSTRTTWKAWREAHPDTDLFPGDPPGHSPR